MKNRLITFKLFKWPQKTFIIVYSLIIPKCLLFQYLNQFFIVFQKLKDLKKNKNSHTSHHTFLQRDVRNSSSINVLRFPTKRKPDVSFFISRKGDLKNCVYIKRYPFQICFFLYIIPILYCIKKTIKMCLFLLRRLYECFICTNNLKSLRI